MNITIVQHYIESLGQQLFRFRVAVFLLVLVILYAGIAWRVSVLTAAEPDKLQIASQTKASSNPRIDPDIVDKIKQLEDNSINVQSLFDQARKNPFQE